MDVEPNYFEWNDVGILWEGMVGLVSIPFRCEP